MKDPIEREEAINAIKLFSQYLNNWIKDAMIDEILGITKAKENEVTEWRKR